MYLKQVFKNRRILFSTLGIATAILICGCNKIETSTSTTYVDMDREDSMGGTGIDSQDIRTICQRMCRSILETPRIIEAKTRAVIEITPVKNHSRFRIDADIFTLKIRNQLLKFAQGKVLFLAANSDKANIERIRDEKRNGVTSGSVAKDMLGAEYILTGTIKGVSKARFDKRSDYIVFSFELFDAETRELVWADDYEFKKTDDVGTVYR